MSKTYVAVQRSGQKYNELTHWKYIKKKKLPNGKWRYYYDIEDAIGVDEHAAKIDADFNVYESEKRAKLAQQEYDDSNIFNRRKKRDNYINAQSDYVDALIEQSNANLEYGKTPLSKIESAGRCIDEGINYIKKKLGIH